MKYLCAGFSAMLWQAVIRFRLVLVFIAVVICFNRTLDFFTVSGLENRHFMKECSSSGNCEDNTLKNKFWKMAGAGEVCRQNTDLQYFAFMNRDITDMFLPVNEFVAAASSFLYRLAGNDDVEVVSRRSMSGTEEYDTVLQTSSGMRLEIMHECTGLKQIVLLLVTALFARGGARLRMTFFLISSAVFLLFNQARILALVWTEVSFPEYFGVMHDYIFSYGIYAVLLLCVVLWNEIVERKLEKR